MTVRGGGYPTTPLASMPLLRMGLPPRSFAADAHGCIMVRILRGSTEYKVVTRTVSNWRALLGSFMSAAARMLALARRCVSRTVPADSVLTGFRDVTPRSATHAPQIDR
jgi:hypothetical protein